MDKKTNVSEQFSRMRELMNYGLNESKKPAYTGVEYTKEACDGKTYGIVREGTKFYIKVANKKNSVLAENFEYIGGFRNRKDYEYDSFANAQKNFDLKMRSIAEARGKNGSIIIESWNPDKQEELTVEGTEKMRKEIARERQIMENTSRIMSKKPISAIKEDVGDPFSENPDKEFKDAQKSNMSSKPDTSGNAKKANDGYKNASLKNTEIKEAKDGVCPKCGEKECKCDKDDIDESSEILGWNRGNDDYMDKSHGTEIGDSAPFDDAKGRDIDDKEGTSTTGEMENGVVEEEKESTMVYNDDQNKPKPGVGEVGDNQPFDGEMGRQIDEDIEDMDDDVLADDEPIEVDDDFDDDVDVDSELDADADVDGVEGDDELELADDEMEKTEDDRLSNLEDMVSKIAEKLGIGKYDDDELYDDDTEGAVLDTDDGDVDDNYSDDFDAEGDDDIEDDEDEVFESKSYREMRLREEAEVANKMRPFKDAGRVPSGNMNKLDDFGKHPAYQKKVMSLPPKDMKEFPEYYDMNDDSVKNDSPYGEKIGSGAPFELDVDAITNAIAESIRRTLKNL